MRRLALLLAAAAALACRGETVSTDPGPLDRFFYPTGVGVLDGRVVVASSNADLTYTAETGGTVISASYCELANLLSDPAAPDHCAADTVAGAVNVPSFTGQLGVADPASCAALAPPDGKGAAVLVPIRGRDVVYRLAAEPSGALTCPDGCEVPVGSSQHGDPFAVQVACGPGLARAFVGYLRQSGGAWLTQIDLTKESGDAGYVLHRLFEDSLGQVRAMAYDQGRSRLYFTRTASSASTWLSYVDLGGGCAFDVLTPQTGGCSSDRSVVGDLPEGLELRGVGLSHEPEEGGRKRAYLTARIYDAVAARSAGARVGDFDGLLLVVDLWEDLYGRLRIDLVEQIPIGYGAGDLVVLPDRPGKRDVVAAVAVDDGNLWIYDDETGARVALGRNAVTGAPVVGHGPALAAEPAARAGNVARVYVSSFGDGWVTPVDVPLDDPEAAAAVAFPEHDPTCTPGAPCLRRIGPQLNQPVVIP